ncbi:hypothetical protein TNCV_3517341 [Trichonephila clavipes]|nr:hypothetical protein TNCV_3517341 [Trichonephila clavipes]
MAASGSSFIPTPLTHADNLGEGHPRDIARLIIWKFFYQTQQQAHEQGDVQLSTYVIVRSCDSAIALCGPSPAPSWLQYLSFRTDSIVWRPFSMLLVTIEAPSRKISASSISNYDCILSPFFIPHLSERNAITIVQFSDKSTEDFPVICYTDGSKID